MKKTYAIILSFVLIVLTLTMPTMAQDDAVTVFSEAEWVHVSVGGDTIGSVVWQQYDDDTQLVFYAYNDSGLSYNQFLIEPDTIYTDPLEKFQILWNGEITAENKIMLQFSSDIGQTTTVVKRFAGETPSWGRPGTRYKQRIITQQQETMDVFIDEEHICSFEWQFVTINNQSSPQLIVYSPDGTEFDTKVLKSTFLSLVEFYDQVGFMFEKMGTDYVKWMLYSDYELQVRIGQGFGTKPLPFFKVSPADLDVYPGDIVTVEWTLPEGVTEYEASWEDKQISEYVRLVDENVFSDQYETTFEFLDSAKNQKFTIKVSCNKYGTIYQGKAKITVLLPLIESLLGLFVAIPILIILAYLFTRHLMHRTREPTTVDTAIKEST